MLWGYSDPVTSCGRTEVRHGWLSLMLGLCAAAEGLGPWLPGLVQSGGLVRVRP